VKERADVVVIGAGIVGCSLAHYLTLAGVRNLVVIDQGPIGDTGGSSFHAPGLCFQTNGSKLACTLAQWSSDLYRELDTPERRTWWEVGSLEVATTPERLAELHRRHAFATAWGLEAHVIGSDEAHRRFPLLDGERILGALWVPSDGIAKGTNICEALRERAESRGATFIGSTRATGIDKEGGRVRAVETDRGRITTSTALVSLGLWGPEFMRGLGLPLVAMQPMQHLFAWSEPLPELAGTEVEIELPILRHQDRAMYVRQRGDAIGIGAYEHAPITIEPDELERHPDGHQIATGPFSHDHWDESLAWAKELLPPLAGVGIAETFNGHFSFAVDNNSFAGPSTDVAGLWLADGIWVTHGGGTAKAVADLITTGHCALDLGPMHPDRLHAFQHSPLYVRERGKTQYDEVYDIIHPGQVLAHPRGVRTTPWHERFLDHGAELTESAGWERAQWFRANDALPLPAVMPNRSPWAQRHWSPTIGREHLAARTGVGVFDLTPFVKVEAEGPGVVEWLNRVCASEMDRPVGRILYTTVLDHDGGCVCDLTVTRLSTQRYLLVTGGGSGPRDVAWLRSELPEGDAVRLRDVSSSTGVLGLWGPRSGEVLARLSPDDLSFPYLSAHPIWVGAVPALALRISYAGELGWELYTPTEHGRYLWDQLFEAGADLGIVACGTGAFNSLRMEKGYRFAGVDMTREHTPWECGLGFTVHFTKPRFNGREAALAARARGPRKLLRCLVLDDVDATCYGGEPLLRDGHAVGYVTSADFGYTVGRHVVLAWLPPELAHEGAKVDIGVFGEYIGATVTHEPLYDPKGERLRV
jgi:glycine cleavage system aminomethyltransferase T/glycine/D-amino acid oxidase-like deaminating enzyme